MESEKGAEERHRCVWTGKDPLLQQYHDDEWGFPVEDDTVFFERLILEIFQAGLNWRLILYKREALRTAFAGFSIPQVASFGEKEIGRLLNDRAIVRNRRKIEATIENARIFSQIIREHGSFKNYLAQFDGGDEACLLREFKKRFRFMGPKIAASFLQSVGKIPAPHDPGCWRSTRL